MKQPIPFITPSPRRVNRYRRGHYRRKILRNPIIPFIPGIIATIISLFALYCVFLNP